MLQFEGFLTDRGSKYAVSGGAISSKADADIFIKELCRKKKYAKATHNTWAAILHDHNGNDLPIKNDDGESGAGMIILRMLEREKLYNNIIVVTRWYGGKHLGGDRFRHVQNSVRHYFKNK